MDLMTYNQVAGVPPVAGEIVPEGVSFDGLTDSLTRDSAFVGEANSKTITFSCWIYFLESASGYILYSVSPVFGLPAVQVLICRPLWPPAVWFARCMT